MTGTPAIEVKGVFKSFKTFQAVRSNDWPLVWHF